MIKWREMIRSVYRQTPFRSKKQGISEALLRPFNLQDLESVPRNWRIDGPDFVGIGVQKAGTSWWHSLILQHPQVRPNRLRAKELSYFPHFLESDPDEATAATYKQAFAAPPGCICGEWSPIYFYFPLCIERLSKIAPDTKVLILLRNPIDRFFSGLNQLHQTRVRNMRLIKRDRYLYEVFSIFPQAIYSSKYSETLKKTFRLFHKSKVLILQYEKCKKDSRQEISRTYRFLGIDETFVPQKISEAINKKPYLKAPLTQTQRDSLKAYFQEDVCDTSKLVPDIDLTLWPEFANL